MTNLSPNASERLTQSRERIRLAMLELASPIRESSTAGAQNFSDSLLNSLKSKPGADLLLSLLQDWWSRQPLRASLTLAADAAQVLLKPIAQHHPLGLVMGAAAAGALLVLTKPWHWIAKPALLVGLLPQLVTQVMQHMTAMGESGRENAR